jgi:glycerophosphoryl diester phosphodiesterase
MGSFYPATFRAVPRAADFAYLDWPAPIPFAHRGGASEVPENTLPAFQHAVDLGYRYVETDVHVTADGVLLAFHDDVLDRVTDRRGAVADLPWSEVSRARVDGREPIPLLADLLATWPDLRVNIDPKHDAAVDPLIEVLRATAAVERVCVGAFSDERVARVREALPGICTSLGPGAAVQLALAVQGEDVGELPDPCAQVPTHFGETEVVTAAMVDEVHRRGMQVHVWTIDERDEMQRLLDLGVDGIMTDRPAVLREVLESRGQWNL